MGTVGPWLHSPEWSVCLLLVLATSTQSYAHQRGDIRYCHCCLKRPTHLVVLAGLFLGVSIIKNYCSVQDNSCVLRISLCHWKIFLSYSFAPVLTHPEFWVCWEFTEQGDEKCWICNQNIKCKELFWSKFLCTCMWRDYFPALKSIVSFGPFSHCDLTICLCLERSPGWLPRIRIHICWGEGPQKAADSIPLARNPCRAKRGAPFGLLLCSRLLSNTS